MSDESEDIEPPEDDGDDEQNVHPSQPIQGHVRHSNVSARVPESVGQGVFSNGVLILTGQFEIVLDFVLRMAEQQRIVARCILPRMVGQQLVQALQQNLQHYESRFGPLPKVPAPKQIQSSGESPEAVGEAFGPSFGFADHPENGPAPKSTPNIEDIYDELKVDDEIFSGSYANAVLIRHSGTEFCLDFIANFFPRSAVSARVYLAAPHIRPLLNSLIRSLTPPGTSQDFA